MIDDCKKRMPLSPKVMTTKELFEGRRYVIPEYQRDYVWDKEENIKPFVQAIAEGVAKSEDVFLGTTLFRETEDGKFEVMDGRQRLTTLAVLSELCGESRGSELFGDEAKKEKVKKEIEEVFTKVMQEVAAASDVRGGADDSDERFKEAFAKQLLENVYFVVVDSKLEIAKTFEIFKSINMTGKPLAEEDIVKVIYAEHIACSCKGDSYDEKLTAAVKKVNSLYQKIKGEYLKPIDVLHVLQACLVADERGTFDEFAQKRVDFLQKSAKQNRTCCHTSRSNCSLRSANMSPRGRTETLRSKLRNRSNAISEVCSSGRDTTDFGCCRIWMCFSDCTKRAVYLKKARRRKR